MKYTQCWTVAVGTAALLLSSAALGQNNANLGDYARQVRKQKAQAAPAAKTFDNDNLPKDDKLSVVGQQADSDQSAQAPDTSAQPTEGKATGEAAAPSADSAKASNPGGEKETKDAEAEKQKIYKDWQKKLHEQKNKIDLQSRELDVANREYRLRAAAFYADAGNRLRNEAAWDKEDAQYKEQIAAKQKALDEAKQGLEDMQEEARKAGVPSSFRD